MSKITVPGKKHKVFIDFVHSPVRNPESFSRMWVLVKAKWPNLTKASGVAGSSMSSLTYIGTSEAGDHYFQVWGNQTLYVITATEFNA